MIIEDFYTKNVANYAFYSLLGRVILGYGNSI